MKSIITSLGTKLTIKLKVKKTFHPLFSEYSSNLGFFQPNINILQNFSAMNEIIEIGKLETEVVVDVITPPPEHLEIIPLSLVKRTYFPKVKKRRRKHGWLKRMSTPSGRWIIKRRRRKGRKYLTV